MWCDGDAHDIPRGNAAEVVEAVVRDVRANAGAHLRAAEALEHRRNSSLDDPAGKKVAERVGGRVVGVGVAVHRETALPGGRDLAEKPAGAAPVVDARELQVRDLHVDARRLRDRDRLVYG